MTFRVIPYRAGSRSASALAQALGGRVLRLQGSTWRQRLGDTVINWGNSNPQFMATHNGDTGILTTASNKLRFFQSMPDGITPRYWTNGQDIPDDVFPIVCRTVLAGHSGEGIVIANNRQELVRASLYVQYKKKQSEYRIHLGRRGNAIVTIAEQKKVRRRDHDNPNWLVRNHTNGFIYQREGIMVPEAVRNAAEQSFVASRLDFGAVDVIFNAREGRAYVLEINTAPGLEGQTITDYANFFRGG